MALATRIRETLELPSDAGTAEIVAELRRLLAVPAAVRASEDEEVARAAASFVSVEADGVDMDSVRLHVAAERLIGREGYSEAEYVAAVQRVQAGSSRELQEVRLELGLADPSEEKVDERLLLDRAGEIIREQGLLPDWDGVGPSEEQRKAALRQALEELGDLGEERRDLAASAVPDVLRRQLTRADAIHNTALAQLGGRLPESEGELLAAYERAQAEVDLYTAGGS